MDILSTDRYCSVSPTAAAQLASNVRPKELLGFEYFMLCAVCGTAAVRAALVCSFLLRSSQLSRHTRGTSYNMPRSSAGCSATIICVCVIVLRTGIRNCSWIVCHLMAGWHEGLARRRSLTRRLMDMCTHAYHSTKVTTLVYISNCSVCVAHRIMHKHKHMRKGHSRHIATFAMVTTTAKTTSERVAFLRWKYCAFISHNCEKCARQFAETNATIVHSTLYWLCYVLMKWCAMRATIMLDSGIKKICSYSWYVNEFPQNRKGLSVW